MSKPQTNVPETTDSTESTESTTETAAPAAKKRNHMAAKKTTLPAPVSLSYKVAGVAKKGSRSFAAEYNWYSAASQLIATARGLYPVAVAERSFAKAEIAMALAVLMGGAKASPVAASTMVAKLSDEKRESLVKTLYAAVTGVPQDGMDAAVAPHLAELAKDYAANWASFLRTDEGKALRAGSAEAAPASPYGYGAKAAGGQQALSTQERLAADEAKLVRLQARIEAQRRAERGE